jgi:muconate cycloisomerase
MTAGRSARNGANDHARGGVELKIESVQAYPLSITVDSALAIVSAQGAHRISQFVIVVVQTDQGHNGFGEANVVPIWSGESQAGALDAIQNIIAPLIIGCNPVHVGHIHDLMDRALVGNNFTKAGVEIAVLDAAGKILNVPVSDLLGGPRRPPAIPLKFSIGAFSPERVVAVAEKAVALGLRAVKVKVGINVSEDIARVEALRKALGDEFPISVDANAGWTESEATLAAPQLERLGVNAIEEPLRRGDFAACARLRQRTRIPIMLDESVFTPDDALEAIRHNACDIISIYPGKNGGVWRSLQIAHLAAAAGLECTIGSNTEWEIGSAAMLHLAVAIPNLSQTICHDIIGPLYHSQAVGTKLRIEKGCALVYEGPGLGVEVDREAIGVVPGDATHKISPAP